MENLQYLHLTGIVHRDLKPENILVIKDNYFNSIQAIKVTDFGLSKIVVPGEKMIDSCGTLAYVAPEVITQKGYHKEVDVWSTGVILFTLMSKTLPFTSPSKKEVYKLIKDAIIDLTTPVWEGKSEEAKDLITKMLNKDPEVRISVDEALKHEFFQKN